MIGVELVPDGLAALHAYARALSGDVGAEPPPAEAAALRFVGLAAAERGDGATARAHRERLLTLLAPGTDEHRAVGTALVSL